VKVIMGLWVRDPRMKNRAAKQSVALRLARYRLTAELLRVATGAADTWGVDRASRRIGHHAGRLFAMREAAYDSRE
jgi:hypothetical protein